MFGLAVRMNYIAVTYSRFLFQCSLHYVCFSGAGCPAQFEFVSKDIDGAPVDAAQSFEKFLGRRYDPAEVDLSDSIGGQRLARRPLPSRSSVLETPLQSYQRLRIEVDNLKQDISRLNESDSRWLGAYASADGGRAAGVWPALHEGLSLLEAQLAELAASPHLSVRVDGQFQVHVFASVAGFNCTFLLLTECMLCVRSTHVVMVACMYAPVIMFTLKNV